MSKFGLFSGTAKEPVQIAEGDRMEWNGKEYVQVVTGDGMKERTVALFRLADGQLVKEIK